MSFSNTGGTTTSTFGLKSNSGIPTSSSFYDLINNPLVAVSSIVKDGYALAPFGNNTVYATVSGDIYLYNADAQSATKLSNGIVSYAMDAANL